MCRGTVGEAARWRGRCFAEDEELDERADQQDYRQLSEQEALRKRKSGSIRQQTHTTETRNMHYQDSR